MEKMWQHTGFLQTSPDVPSSMEKLTALIPTVSTSYKNFSREELLYKATPTKWSKQEIIGHLVDSAINNLVRFTEIQFLPQPYEIKAYRQNELVAVNHYQELAFDHILNLWKALNFQIIFVVENMAIEKMDYPVKPQYDDHEIKTLGWTICDYVAHMEHHFRQVML